MCGRQTYFSKHILRISFWRIFKAFVKRIVVGSESAWRLPSRCLWLTPVLSLSKVRNALCAHVLPWHYTCCVYAYIHQPTTGFHRYTTLTLVYRITLRILSLTLFQMGLPCWHRLLKYTTRPLCLLAVRHRSYAGARCMVTSPVGWCLAHELCRSRIFHHCCT